MDKFTQPNHGWTADIYTPDKHKMRKEIVMEVGPSPFALVRLRDKCIYATC